MTIYYDLNKQYHESLRVLRDYEQRVRDGADEFYRGFVNYAGIPEGSVAYCLSSVETERVENSLKVEDVGQVLSFAGGAWKFGIVVTFTDVENSEHVRYVICQRVRDQTHEFWCDGSSPTTSSLGGIATGCHDIYNFMRRRAMEQFARKPWERDNVSRMSLIPLHRLVQK